MVCGVCVYPDWTRNCKEKFEFLDFTNIPYTAESLRFTLTYKVCVTQSLIGGEILITDQAHDQFDE